MEDLFVGLLVVRVPDGDGALEYVWWLNPELQALYTKLHQRRDAPLLTDS